MSIYGTTDLEERIKNIKYSVDTFEVIGAFVEINADEKACCPFHDDSTPSMKVYENGFYCFGCDEGGDVIDFVRRYLELAGKRVTFDEVLTYLEKLSNGQKPAPKIKKMVTEAIHKDYVPALWLSNYRHNLTSERRIWLHDRLISDHTIDLCGLGWRGDYNAYAIPFYSGFPLESPATVIQYRSTPQTRFYNKEWRYIGHAGYYYPDVINRHLINDNLTIMFIGTLDAILGFQDGIPSISTNGATVFSNGDKAQAVELKRRVGGVHNLYVVPDATLTEFEPAYILAEYLGGTVKFFPKGGWGKDYTDWRKAGYTSGDFMKEVLSVDFPPLDETNNANYLSVVESMAKGDAVKAVNDTNKILASGVQLHIARYLLCLATHVVSAETLLPFIRSDMNQFEDEINMCKNAGDIITVVAGWADKADNKRGGW